MPRILGLGLAGLLLVYSSLATLFLAFDDHRYHSRYFTPIADQDWRLPGTTPPCGKVQVAPCSSVEYTFPDCEKFNPVQCWLYPNSGVAPRKLIYRDGDLSVEVHSVDLGIGQNANRHKIATDALSPQSMPGKVPVMIVVTNRNGSADVDVGRIATGMPCGPSVATNKVKAERVTVFSISETTNTFVFESDKTFRVEVDLPADPTRLSACVLKLGDAIKTPSGRKIPDVSFRSIPVARYDVVTTD